MTLTVRLPDRLEQKLAEYCTTYRVTRSDAVKHALEDLLEPSAPGKFDLDHPFIGCDKGDGSDVSGNIKAALRARFRKNRRCRAILTVDQRDFGIYRLKGGKRFEVVKWFE